MKQLRAMTWPKAARALKNSVVILPVGSVEQHGRHLPLGADHLTAEAQAREAAGAVPGTVLAPTLPYGVSPHHRQFAGTVWVETDTFRHFVEEIIHSFAYHGVRKFVVVNGHGGNDGALSCLGREVRQAGLFLAYFDWWHHLPKGVLEKALGAKGASIVGHACAMETSMGLHYYPDWVELRAAKDVDNGWAPPMHGGVVHFDTIDFTPHGNVGYPSEATAEGGRNLAEAAIRNLIALCRWVKRTPLPKLVAKPNVKP